MEAKGKGRVLWVERAQVFSMLLVALHHSVPHGYGGPAWLLALLTGIQYPALVCFFFASGLFANHWKTAGYAAYMKKRAARLLTPYFCVNLLMLAPRYAAARLMGVEVRLSAGWVLASFLNPHGQGISPHLWFLLTLFIMAALDAMLSRRAIAPIALAALLILSALPVQFPTLLCLNELRLYLGWFAAGYALALTRGSEPPLRGARGLAAGAAGLIAFILALAFPAMPLALFIQMAGGALAMLAAAGLRATDDPLTAAFRGKTYVIYILSMCVQNLVEVVGYSAGWPWALTFLAMLAAGLAVPCGLWAWNRRHPLPKPLRLMTGL